MSTSAIRSNPFSTRFTRPGALHFVGDVNLIDSAVLLYHNHRFIGQIVGPHGCGKTSLSCAIEGKCRTTFQSIRHVTLRQTGRFFSLRNSASDKLFAKMPWVQPTGNDDNKCDRKELLIIDGIESLSFLQRWVLIATCRRRGIGLLLTTHRRLARIPVIASLQSNLDTFREIVAVLDPNLTVDPAGLAKTFSNNGGNIRESLMELYDQFEETSRT